MVAVELELGFADRRIDGQAHHHVGVFELRAARRQELVQLVVHRDFEPGLQLDLVGHGHAQGRREPERLEELHQVLDGTKCAAHDDLGVGDVGRGVGVRL